MRAIALVSGGLDSILAVKIIQEQGIEVECIVFETPFFSAGRAVQSCNEMDIPLTVVDITADHLVMLRAPRYGYGRNVNPCIDCHILMLKKAGERMKAEGADFILTGEVVGQRPMSQGKQALHVVAKRSGYQEYIVRPLSARLLPETKPEIDGKVDRLKLLEIEGRGRKRQIEMAVRYKIDGYATPAGGCLLTDPGFARRLRDLFTHDSNMGIRDIELLKVGRHLRLNDKTKLIAGRKEIENVVINSLSQDRDIVINVRDYPGPTVLVPYGCEKEYLRIAAGICALYSDAPSNVKTTVKCRAGDIVSYVDILPVGKEVVQKLLI
ncbi:MAG: tRNA 4-thiouridine(8) synthase ThiI [Thermodesulfobacteriota bacterium]|nr:tRNA 4-thiouridine(8) synthase ThiI [Thermodesulfobacteriota bacterium]